MYRNVFILRWFVWSFVILIISFSQSLSMTDRQTHPVATDATFSFPILGQHFSRKDTVFLRWWPFHYYSRSSLYELGFCSTSEAITQNKSFQETLKGGNCYPFISRPCFSTLMLWVYTPLDLSSRRPSPSWKHSLCPLIYRSYKNDVSVHRGL